MKKRCHQRKTKTDPPEEIDYRNHQSKMEADRAEEIESDLPDEIKQHILSFMDYADTVRVSAVSKSWRYAASTLQCLILTDDFTLRDPESSTGDDDDDDDSVKYFYKITSMLKDFTAAFVKKVEAKENFLLQKLSIVLKNNKFDSTYPDMYVNDLMELIGSIAVTALSLKGNDCIREFVLDVGDQVNRHHRLPEKLWQHICVARSLHKLVLGGLNLSSYFSNFEIDLPMLRELYLSRNGIDDSLLELLTTSSRLEILEIKNCNIFHQLKVSGSQHKLKRIVMEDVRVLNIEIQESPNLEVFCFRNENLSCQSHILDLAACKSLKILQLDNVYGEVGLLKSIEQLLPGLDFLEVFKAWLVLSYNCRMEKFRISSNTLRELHLRFSLPLDIQVNAPLMSEFSYHGFISSNLSIETSSIQESNVVGQGKKVSVRRDKDNCDIKFDVLLQFFKSLNHFEEVKLEDVLWNELTVPEEYRSNFRSSAPLGNVKHLTLGTDHYLFNGYNGPISLDLLESVLWMAPRLGTLTFVDYSKFPRTFQFMHEDSSNVDQEVPFTSWSNSIPMRVKVESCPAGNDARGLGLKKYFFKNAENFLEGNAEEYEIAAVMS